MINEFEWVVLLKDQTENGYMAGDVGIVVMIHGDHQGYELEMFSANGDRLDVITVDGQQVRSVQDSDVLHVRVKS